MIFYICYLPAILLFCSAGILHLYVYLFSANISSLWNISACKIPSVELGLALGLDIHHPQVYTKAQTPTTVLAPHTLLATQQGLSLDQRACLKFPYVTLNNRASQHDAISLYINTLHVHGPKTKLRSATTGTTCRMWQGSKMTPRVHLLTRWKQKHAMPFSIFSACMLGEPLPPRHQQDRRS